MNIHPHFQALLDLYAQSGRPPYYRQRVAAARTLFEAAIAAAPPQRDLPEIAAATDREIAGPHGAIPVRIYLPVGAPRGAFVYAHSGGWVIGSIAQVDNYCRRLTSETGCTVLNVGYRLAPEHPFPQPLDDIFAVLKWAAAEYPGPLFVGGESAGGNLAAAAAIRARDEGGPLVAGQMLACPVTDWAHATPSMKRLGDADLLLTRADMGWFWDHYCPPGIDRTSPLASPLHVADPAGLPPLFLVVAEHDPLRDEGLAYAAKLARAGVSVASRAEPGMLHGFAALAGVLAPATDVLRQLGAWTNALIRGAER